MQVQNIKKIVSPAFKIMGRQRVFVGRLLHILFLQGRPNMVIALVNKTGFYLFICIVLKKCV
jgi:hypothetical protein